MKKIIGNRVFLQMYDSFLLKEIIIDYPSSVATDIRSQIGDYLDDEVFRKDSCYFSIEITNPEAKEWVKNADFIFERDDLAKKSKRELRELNQSLTKELLGLSPKFSKDDREKTAVLLYETESLHFLLACKYGYIKEKLPAQN